MPRTYLELTEALLNPLAGADRIARIIETDPAMCAKILQLVNSAYFGLAHKQTSVAKAVAYLGTELVKGLALTAHVFIALQGAPVEGFSIDPCWLPGPSAGGHAALR